MASFQGADADTHQQHQDHHGCSGGQRQQRGGRGGAPGGDHQQCPPARQQTCILSPAIGKIQNAGRGAGGDLATVNVEDTLANMWALDDVGAALDGSSRGSLPLPTLLCRTTDEVLLEIQRDQRQLQPRRSSENAHCQPSFGAVSPENRMKSEIDREKLLGPLSFETPPLNWHLLVQQQLQSQFENGIPSFEMTNERRGNAHVIGLGNGNYHNVRTANGVYHQPDCYDQQTRVDGLPSVDGLGNGGKSVRGVDGSARMPGGETGAGSPKSSISSDGSGGDPVGNSPAAVWEVGMRRGAGKGGGTGSSVGGRKRTLDVADEDVVGLREPQMIRASESLASLRDRELSIDGLKQLFLQANMELGPAPTGGGEAMKENDDNFKLLLQLLKVTSVERDEARDQLQRLLNKIAHPTPLDHSPNPVHPDLQLTGRTRASSGVTAFDAQSQAHSYHPYALSPVESLFESSSNPELPNRSMSDFTGTVPAQQPPLPECNNSMPPGVLRAQAVEFDPASAIIDRLVAKKALPEKGKLLQAVMEAGPLLQTLLVAGSLPRWRNPPPLQPFQIPPVSVRGRESSFLNQTAALNQNYLVLSSPPPKVFHRQNSLVASQMYATSSLGGSSGLSGLCARGPMASTCASSYRCPLVKRQRF